MTCNYNKQTLKLLPDSNGMKDGSISKMSSHIGQVVVLVGSLKLIYLLQLMRCGGWFVFKLCFSSLDGHSKRFTVQFIDFHPFTHTFIQWIYRKHFFREVQYGVQFPTQGHRHADGDDCHFDVFIPSMGPINETKLAINLTHTHSNMANPHLPANQKLEILVV